MYVPRTICTALDWQDGDGGKLYTISKHGGAVAKAPFLERMAKVKAARPVAWSDTPHFAILHDGTARYLIVAWWGNDNELFTSVSVETEAGWVEDPQRYSFCVYDLEVFWYERNAYIDTVDCPAPDLAAYRRRRAPQWLPAS